MRGPSKLSTALAFLAGVSLAAPGLGAQQSVQEWLDRCEEQNERRSSSTARYCEVKEYSIAASRRPLAVDARENGGISVVGWDGDSVLITAKIQARARDETDARALARQIRVETSGGTIRAEGPPARGRESWSVDYEILVPMRSDLALETYNGPIAVRDVSGHMELRAHNGPLSLRGVGGDVRGRTTNGPLAVQLEGTTWSGRGLDLETDNGPIDLSIPEGYSARLETGTTNGPMRVNFPITVQGRMTGRISTELGDGGAPIRVITTNGPVTIKRR